MTLCETFTCVCDKQIGHQKSILVNRLVTNLLILKQTHSFQCIKWFSEKWKNVDIRKDDPIHATKGCSPIRLSPKDQGRMDRQNRLVQSILNE